MNNTIMSIGFSEHVKGMDLLIKAFKKISLRIPGWNISLIGQFEADMPLLGKLSEGNPSIKIKSPVCFHEIPNIIDHADIFVLASRKKAMGRGLVEAMARSKPRFAARVGRKPTVIENEEDGLLFESNNVQELTDQVGRLIKDKILREKLAKNANLRFIKRFTLEVYIAKK